MIKSVEIENFRGFRKVALSGLRRVNIVVGDNGSGKTAFLEALFLASTSSPQAALTLRQWRGLETGGVTTTVDVYDAMWLNLFSDFDHDKTINIKLHDSENNSRSLTAYFDKAATITLPLMPETTEQKQPQGVFLPVVFCWKSPDNPDVILTIRSTIHGIQIEGLSRESNIRSAFIPAYAQTSHQYTAVLFSNLSIQNRESEFVEALKKQFPSINKVSVEIEAGAHAIFVSVPGITRKIQLGLFSNAASNLASMLLNIAGSPKGILCIDEVENGFHYTRFARVWDQLHSFADSFETQIFASTHSAECLNAAAKAFENSPDDFSLIQIVKQNGAAKAFIATGEDAASAILHGLDVRK